MGKIREKTVLSELNVKEAMRRQLVTLPVDSTLEQSIRHLIKFKVSALLIVGEESTPVGVLSKTDLIGAYYADMSVNEPVSSIMASPPFFCSEADTLEDVLQTMRQNRVYRLYVRDPAGLVSGIIAYPDIVGMLYSFCRDCPQSKWQRAKKTDSSTELLRFKVKELMTPSVMSCSTEDSLTTVLESISVNQVGALLIVDSTANPVGVVSKTDLILAFRRGVPVTAKAAEIMTRPVRSIDQEECLETALHKLIFSQLHRLFVSAKDPLNMVGVLSLSDAARMRSGSCHACVLSRIKVEER
jgi:signal-transduction protein with cAMP-binding, CBS, and nucleotidyltransferase domain